jgi:hypothetical protein
MNRTTLAAAITAAALIISAAPAVAQEKKQGKRATKAVPTVTITQAQFMAMLQMLSDRQQTPAVTTPAAPGRPGDPGKAGADGRPGDRGQDGTSGKDGAAGKDGEAGRDGVDGRDGKDGRDGVGFAQGTIFLVNGSCPTGTTMQGPQNRWTVYANDTSGRPWTTTGSSAQLFLSACQVN